MDHIFSCILLLLSLSGTFSKYVYVDQRKGWYEAQWYCEQYYTDLVPINNKHDVHQLEFLSGNVNFNNYIWIGLKRNSSDRNKWTWSGGGLVSWFFWALSQPSGGYSEDYGAMNGKWTGTYIALFYSVFVYSKRFNYITHTHTLASETEMLLIQKELKKQDTSEHVWIGLHFFPGDWLWVDRQEMDYEVWGHGGKPSCPPANMDCAVLQVNGGSKSVWGAHDCEERLSFICY